MGGERRPQLCVGTDDATPTWLRDLVVGHGHGKGWDVELDTPFRGTYVPLDHLGDARLASVMLELRRDVYVDDASWQLTGGAASVTEFVADVARAAAEHVDDWPPSVIRGGQVRSGVDLRSTRRLLDLLDREG